MKKYDRIMMETAFLFSQESKCTRGKVGSVLAKDGRVLSTGYNGTIAGIDNDCETTCPVCKGTGEEYATERGFDEFTSDRVLVTTCKRCQGGGKITNDFVVHSEQNLLMYCAKKGIPIEGTTLYITMSPCKMCAKLIASAGVVRVVYHTLYRDDEGINFLKSCNIEVEKYELPSNE